jgi:hypothetical protein
MPAEERVGEPTGEVAPEPATSRRTIPGYVSSRPREVEREKDASERLLDLDRIAHDAYRLAQYGSEPHLQRTVPLLCDSIHALEGSREDEPEAFTEGVEQLTEIQEMLEQGVNNMEVMDEGQKQSYRDLVMSVHDVVTEMLVAMELQDFLIHVNFEQVSELGIPFDETGVQEMSEGEWENYLRQQEAAAQQN